MKKCDYCADPVRARNEYGRETVEPSQQHNIYCSSDCFIAGENEKIDKYGRTVKVK